MLEDFLSGSISNSLRPELEGNVADTATSLSFSATTTRSSTRATWRPSTSSSPTTTCPTTTIRPSPAGACRCQGLRDHDAAGGFPDLRLTVDQAFSDGDQVASMWTMEGTHTGEWFGTPSTGKHARWSGVVITGFANGKIAEDWYNFGQISLLQQLGIIPTADSRGADHPTGHKPLTQEQIKGFVLRSTSRSTSTRRSRPARVLRRPRSQRPVPGREHPRHASFKTWYDRVKTCSSTRTTSCRPSMPTSRARANLIVVVGWQASWWEPPALQGKRVSMDATQAWTVVDRARTRTASRSSATTPPTSRSTTRREVRPPVGIDDRPAAGLGQGHAPRGWRHGRDRPTGPEPAQAAPGRRAGLPRRPDHQRQRGRGRAPVSVSFDWLWLEWSTHGVGGWRTGHAPGDQRRGHQHRRARPVERQGP